MRVALLVLAVSACALRDPPSVTPATPLPADPVIQLQPMQAECDSMVGALEAYKACPNLEPEDIEDLDAWIETANRNFAASRKAAPEENAQHAIAAACRKATDSVKAAALRCAAGPRPKER